jgi:hypothetical protein
VKRSGKLLERAQIKNQQSEGKTGDAVDLFETANLSRARVLPR